MGRTDHLGVGVDVGNGAERVGVDDHASIVLGEERRDCLGGRRCVTESRADHDRVDAGRQRGQL